MQRLIISFKIILYMIQYSFFPFFISIIQIPLITITNNTYITRSRNNMSSWFIINQSLSSFYKLFFYKWFCLCNFYTLEISYYHCSLMKSFFISFLFCLLQKLFIVLTLNFKNLTQFYCCQISICWGINQRYRLNIYHFLSNVILLS